MDKYKYLGSWNNINVGTFSIDQDIKRLESVFNAAVCGYADMPHLFIHSTLGSVKPVITTFNKLDLLIKLAVFTKSKHISVVRVQCEDKIFITYGINLLDKYGKEGFICAEEIMETLELLSPRYKDII